MLTTIILPEVLLSCYFLTLQKILRPDLLERPRPSQSGSDSPFVRGDVGESEGCLLGNLEPGLLVPLSKSLPLFWGKEGGPYNSHFVQTLTLQGP